MPRSEMKHGFGIFQQTLCHSKCPKRTLPQREADFDTDTGKVMEEHSGSGAQEPPACSKSQSS